MLNNSMNISSAARELGVSTRTIRRYIKAGKIKAKFVTGKFGEEYRISELPPDLFQQKPSRQQPTADHSSSRNSSQSIDQVIDIIRELQEKNLALAAQLGVATERVRNLEKQIKLLSTVRNPWWKRLFGKKR